jgi:hypothetical protein
MQIKRLALARRLFRSPQGYAQKEQNKSHSLHFRQVLVLLPVSLAPILCFLAVLSSGCSRSNQVADNAPVDIRGEPINAPASNSIAAASEPVRETLATDSVPPAPPLVIPEEKAAENQKSDFITVTFDKLASYEFEMPDETVTTNGIVSASVKAKDQFPPAVKALDKVRVALKGFMLPLKVESGLVTEMLIMRDQSMCCYGKVPKITEWVSVKMADKGVKAVIDQPITIYGKLYVGEMRENGYLVGIYRMDGDRITVPE